MFTRPIARPPSPPAAHPLPPISRTHCGVPSPQRPFSLIVQRGRDEVMVRRVGLLGLAGARMCPNLLQRRLGPGSAARRSAEYQRFSSRTPMESRPLQQIWTTGATADLSEAAGVAPPDRKIIHRAVMRVRDAGTAPPSPSSSPLTPTPSPSPTTSPGPRPRDRRCTAPTGCRRRRPGPPSAGPTRTSAPEPPAAPGPAQTRRRS